VHGKNLRFASNSKECRKNIKATIYGSVHKNCMYNKETFFEEPKYPIRVVC
jgi:hypothetical protein